MSEQIKPLSHSAAPIWDYDSSDYPDRIKLPMQDGHVIEYVRAVEQPHPKCLAAIDLIKVMMDNTFGGYKAKHVKK